MASLYFTGQALTSVAEMGREIQDRVRPTPIAEPAGSPAKRPENGWWPTVDTRLHYQQKQPILPDFRVVWLVEDDPEDARLIAEALQEMKPAAHVVHLPDGTAALQRLQSQSERKPSLILLALTKGAQSAFQFLGAVKTDEMLRVIPVVALASSHEEGDMLAGYALGLAGYVVKSEDRTRRREEMAVIHAYWTMSRVPRASWR